MDKIYLIMFDNGEDYGDHDSYAVLSCNSKEKAKSVIKEIYDWQKSVEGAMPSWPLEGNTHRQNRTKDQHKAMNLYRKARKAVWASCPYGEEVGYRAEEYIPREAQHDNHSAFYYQDMVFLKGENSVS